MSNINKDIERACLNLKNDCPNLKPISVVEYKDLYVFDTKLITSEGLKDHFLGLMAVRKDDKKVFGFNPLFKDSEDYFEIAKTNRIVL